MNAGARDAQPPSAKGAAGLMSHTSKEKLDLVNRTKKVIGQPEAILRALNDDEQCAEVLQKLAAARDASPDDLRRSLRKLAGKPA
jgi:DNA-binding FrmR family transcriptional regulator